MPRATLRSADDLSSVRLCSVALKVKLVPLKKRAYMRESWKRLNLLNHASSQHHINPKQSAVHAVVNPQCLESSQLSVHSQLSFQSRSDSQIQSRYSSFCSRSVQSHSFSLKRKHLGVRSHSRRPTQVDSRHCHDRPSLLSPKQIQALKHTPEQEGSVHSVSRCGLITERIPIPTPSLHGMVTRRRVKAASSIRSLIPPGVAKYHTIHS